MSRCCERAIGDRGGARIRLAVLTLGLAMGMGMGMGMGVRREDCEGARAYMWEVGERAAMAGGGRREMVKSSKAKGSPRRGGGARRGCTRWSVTHSLTRTPETFGTRKRTTNDD